MLPARFTKALLSVVLALIVLTSLLMFHAPTRTYLDPYTGKLFDGDGVEADYARTRPDLPAKALQGVHGGVIMGKLGNETAKQELGRATWRLMHTMTLRFPEEPTEDERAALDSYFHLQSRLYPCGECAAEFQLLLQKFPPQTSSRRVAALWLCHVHNQVNERLKKPVFDCAHLDETYDCGCGDEPIAKSPALAAAAPTAVRDKLTGAGLIKGGR